MAYKLSDINRKVRECPGKFVAECDEVYNENVLHAAGDIEKNITKSRIVLLAGPSGSGKTTTAINIKNVLTLRGIKTYTVSLDNYYNDVDPNITPRNKNGDYDFESPQCLDLDLIRKHFTELNAGHEVMIPKFEFKSQKRNPNRAMPLKLEDNEIAIFEGIHALNSLITGDGEGSAINTFKIYVSARSNIEDAGKVIFKGTWLRIIRRAVRDMKFRATSPASTFAMWDNLRVGEKKYISPFKNKTDIIIDSSLPYEVSLMKQYADVIFDGIKPGIPRYNEICRLRESFNLFELLPLDYIPTSSLMREFLGGGEISY